MPQVFIDGTHVGGHDELAELERAAKLDPLLAGDRGAGERSRRMTLPSERSFRVGLVQLRSGRSIAPNDGKGAYPPRGCRRRRLCADA